MNSKILATVNGKAITEMDVQVFINNLGPQRGAQFNNDEGKKQILNELINQNLFLVDAQNNSIEKTEECQKEIAKMKEIVLTQVNINQTINSVSVTPEEIKSHFDTNKASYNTPETANTSHILVKTEKECNDLYEKIMNNEIDFAEAAKEYSQCPSKEKNGELGTYAKGKMVPEYDAVSFSLEKGEISKPVKTQFGFHIIKMNEKNAASEAKFDDVQNQISRDLLSQKQREAYMAKVAEMRKTISTEIK